MGEKIAVAFLFLAAIVLAVALAWVAIEDIRDAPARRLAHMAKRAACERHICQDGHRARLVTLHIETMCVCEVKP